MNHRAKRIIIQEIARIKTIGVTKMRGNFFEKPQKARNFVKIRLHYFCTILYNYHSFLSIILSVKFNSLSFFIVHPLTVCFLFCYVPLFHVSFSLCHKLCYIPFKSFAVTLLLEKEVNRSLPTIGVLLEYWSCLFSL